MRNFDFSPLYRSAIGFDRLFNHLENNQSQGNGYPPYNVELVDENHYRIAIAVAGFAENELEITAQDNLLVVKGAHTAEQKERTYLYQGIAERNFERKFQLAENIHVYGANLVNGLLFIDLERVIPEEKKPRRIEINNLSGSLARPIQSGLPKREPVRIHVDLQEQLRTKNSA